MLHKLKRRFILTSVLSVGLVLILTATAICIFTVQAQKTDLKRSLENAVAGVPPLIGPGGHEHTLTGTFTITVNDRGQIIESNTPGNVTMDADVLKRAAEAVLESRENEGTISSMDLMFMTRNIPGGMRIAFASTEGYYATVRTTILVAVVACIALMGFVWLISMLQAHAAVRPVEQAWEQQRRFVADASHDLKTPLTVILANLDILRSHLTSLPEEERRWLDSTFDEAERMKALTLHLLELAKSESLKNTLTLSEVGVSNCTQQIVLQYEPVAFEAGVELSTEIEPDIHMNSDSAAYCGIVEALVDNAVKYSPRGGTVTVRLYRVRGGVCLDVHNTGKPISEEDLPYIFDRFRRADGARSTDGYGLGLAIAQNAAEALGGYITVSSTQEAGTTFVLFLKEK